MRTTKRTSRFKRDYRRELSGVLGKKLQSLLKPVVELLADDKPHLSLRDILTIN